MPATNYPSIGQWRQYFKSRGLDKETVDLYISFVRPIVKKDIPVIFDVEHLAMLLGRTKGYLMTAISATECFYRKFEIPKRSGGKRTIQAPHHSLLVCQQWINSFILSRLPKHQCAVGYATGLSVRDHASPHLGSKEVLVVDMKDFFPSIKLSRVISLFRGLGYTMDVSIALARLCCLNGVLPQGAATSPSISNLICRRLDSRLASLSTKAGASYTRYADDMCFSAGHLRQSFLVFVNKVCSEEGFTLNTKKTRRYSAAANLQLVTGLNVSADKLRLPKSYTRNLQLHLYHIEKHGLLSHMAIRKIKVQNYLEKLLGKVEYWTFIEPENSDAMRYKEMLRHQLSLQRR